MISMHCPSCGAEGRIPNDRVNVRLVCKRCLNSFHLTPVGKIVAGSPPASSAAARHDHPVDDLDVVDHEIEVVVEKLKSAAPKAAILGGVTVALLLGWMLIRGGKVATLDEQTVLIAQALARNDVAELESLATDGTLDEATALSEALASEFRDHAEVLRSTAPSVEVSREPEPPAPGLAAVTATIRADQFVNRTGMAVADISTSITPVSVTIPIVLAGDDRWGWRLDGERTLEAYRKAREPVVPVRAGTPATPPRAAPSTATARADTKSM